MIGLPTLRRLHHLQEVRIRSISWIVTIVGIIVIVTSAIISFIPLLDFQLGVRLLVWMAFAHITTSIVVNYARRPVSKLEEMVNIFAVAERELRETIQYDLAWVETSHLKHHAQITLQVLEDCALLPSFINADQAWSQIEQELTQYAWQQARKEIERILQQRVSQILGTYVEEPWWRESWQLVLENLMADENASKSQLLDTLALSAQQIKDKVMERNQSH